MPLATCVLPQDFYPEGFKTFPNTTTVCVWVRTCASAGAVRVQRVKDKERGGILH